MELVAIIKIPDNAYADYGKWNLVSDSPILVEYEENGYSAYLKDLGTELKLKPMPQRKEFDNQIPYEKGGWNDCIDEIEGKENEYETNSNN